METMLVGRVLSNKRNGENYELEIQKFSNGKLIDEKVKVLNAFYCPVMYGDSIVGICRPDKERPDIFRFVVEPIATIAGSKDSIQHLFNYAMKKTIFPKRLNDALYEHFQSEAIKYMERCSDINDPVYRNCRRIEGMVAEYITYLSNNISDSIIETISMAVNWNIKDARTLLYWWKHNYLYRRLFMLGLTRKQIHEADERGWLTANLYYQLIENPYIVETIPMDVCNKISKQFNLNFDPKVIQGAQLVRQIDEVCKSKSWCCYPLSNLFKIPNGRELLPILEEVFKSEIRYNFIYLRHMAIAENYLSNVLQPESLPDTSAHQEILNRLNNKQRQAIHTSLTNNMSIISGKPGRGKSTTIKALVEELEKRAEPYVICAFTGKAASHLKKIGIRRDRIYTLHRLYSMNIMHTDFQIRWLIVDECSMIYNELIYKVLHKLHSQVRDDLHYIFVGDPNQLLPISEGAFFKQLISSHIPHITLDDDCRRTNSQLSINIDAICDNHLDDLQWEDNCVFIEGDLTTVINVVKSYTKEFDSLNDASRGITVVCPFNAPLPEINEQCRQIFVPNPIQTCTDIFGKTWTIGDRIMMTDNRYDIDVMNGEEGYIIDIQQGLLQCEFPSGIVDIATFLPVAVHVDDDPELSTQPLSSKLLTLSWAMSVHKSQGSEWSHGVYYIPPGAKGGNGFLTRELSITAMSRFKSQLTCIAENYHVIHNSLISPSYPRNDNLGYRIRGVPHANYYIDPIVLRGNIKQWLAEHSN